MIIIPAVVINHTTPLVTITFADPGQPTYAAFLQSLGNFVYKIEQLYLYSDNFVQVNGAIKYNRYDVSGNENVSSITPASDPYGSTNALYLPLTKYKQSFILNGNSSLATTILANTQILVKFFCKRVNGLHNFNFDEIEKVFIKDFYGKKQGFQFIRTDIIFMELPPHIQDRILKNRGLRRESIEKITYNGVSESDDKQPAIMLSFASLMLAFYLFSKD